MKKRTWMTLGAAALAISMTGCGAVTASVNTPSSSNNASSNSSSTSSKWMTVNKTSKSIDLKLEAGVNSGFNFNGYPIGNMTVTVPMGWKVNVNFKNDSPAYNSAMIVTSDQMTKSSGFTPAFSGASTPKSDTGVAQGTTQTFSFTADKVGKYDIISAIPGHISSGMWDSFVVSSSATSPTLTTQ